MGLVENSVVINRPIEEVWNFLLDWDNTPKWYRSITRLKQVSEGPVGIGTALRMATVTGIGGTVRVIEFEPPRLLALRGTGIVSRGATARFILERVGEGTRFTKSEDYRGLLLPVGFMAGRLQKMREPFFAKLKSLLEDSAKAA